MQPLQHFVVGILVTVCFPLLPLFIEWKYGSFISEQSVMIASIMYCTAIALVSESVLVFVVGMFAAIVLSIDYGAKLPTFSIQAAAEFNLSTTCMVLFAFAQISRCYSLHVTQRQNFVYFPRIS